MTLCTNDDSKSDQCNINQAHPKPSQTSFFCRAWFLQNQLYRPMGKDGSHVYTLDNVRAGGRYCMNRLIDVTLVFPTVFFFQAVNVINWPWAHKQPPVHGAYFLLAGIADQSSDHAKRLTKSYKVLFSFGLRQDSAWILLGFCLDAALLHYLLLPPWRTVPARKIHLKTPSRLPI